MSLTIALMPDVWLPIERAERERRSQRAALLTDARRGHRTEPDRPTRRTAFLPRVVGALGLF